MDVETMQDEKIEALDAVFREVYATIGDLKDLLSAIDRADQQMRSGESGFEQVRDILHKLELYDVDDCGLWQAFSLDPDDCCQ